MYKKILEFLIAERSQKDLQKPPPEFMKQVETYLEGLSKEGDGIPEKLREAERERVMWMLERIRFLRREKICRMVLEGVPVDSILFEDEANFFGPRMQETKDDAKKILVRVLRDVPTFVGADMKTYGPYKAEDVVLLPAENAEALIKRGVAIMIQRKV